MLINFGTLFPKKRYIIPECSHHLVANRASTSSKLEMEKKKRISPRNRKHYAQEKTKSMMYKHGLCLRIKMKKYNSVLPPCSSNNVL